MKKEKLRHGQALAMQWVAFAMQKISTDVKSGGKITESLLGDATTIKGTSGLETLSIGCVYVTNFVLPLAIELSLKALIEKEGKTYPQTHNLLKLFNLLSLKTQNILEIQYHSHSENNLAGSCECLRELLENHQQDFEGWRYLDEASTLKREEFKLQYALTTILDIYEII